MNLSQEEIVQKYPHKPLKEQVALVTGANSGIGEAIARHMSAAGAFVGVNYLFEQEKAEKIAHEIQEFGRKAIVLYGDVTLEHQVEAMFKKMITAFERVDILVNNAGIQSDALSEEMTLQEWEEVLKINLTGQFLCAREAIKVFKKKGVIPEISKAAGKIIHISSVHQEIPWSGHINYAASKGGIRQMMRTLAQEEAPEKIRVNSIAPGAIQTPINQKTWEDPEAMKRLLRMIPAQRIGTSDEIAQASVWLASDEADYVVGVPLVVDGGISLHNHFSRGG